MVKENVTMTSALICVASMIHKLQVFGHSHSDPLGHVLLDVGRQPHLLSISVPLSLLCGTDR